MIEVYYAEDDEVIGKSVKEYLEQYNCKVTVFESIAEIRKVLLNHLPTVISLRKSRSTKSGSRVGSG